MSNFKAISPLFFCIIVAGCTSLTKKTVPEESTQINEPIQVQAKPAEVVPVPEPEVVKIEPPKKPVIKPKQKPKPQSIATKTEQGRLILGEQEWVYIPGLDKSFKARVDTGATTSSVSAVEIVPFERDGKDWVKFRIEHEKTSSGEISLPVLRWARVKQSNTTKVQKRPVVTAWIQIGDLKEKADFTLTDRTHLSHPVLLGRSFFRDVAIIDVSRKFIQPKRK